MPTKCIRLRRQLRNQSTRSVWCPRNLTPSPRRATWVHASFKADS
jgi:hypothetical protein